GISAQDGGSVLAEHVSIDTDNDSAHGADIAGRDSRVDLIDGLIVTRGREAHGIAVHYGPRAVVNVTDTRILTAGDFSYGVFISNNDAHATLDGVNIRT
ncbi:hypothetical protein SB757_28145, partial [Pseudomonas sp. SIMBA_065]